jgi:hypothetical protein
MDFGNLSDNIPVIVAIIVLILLQLFFRRKRSPDASNGAIASGILSELRLNIRLADFFSYSKAGKKFTTTSWTLYHNKLDFLNQAQRNAVSNAFVLLEEYNQQIDSAKKFKSTSYLAGLNMDKLNSLLVKAQESLEEWLSSHPDAESGTKIPGIFGDFTGR